MEKLGVGESSISLPEEEQVEEDSFEETNKFLIPCDFLEIPERGFSLSCSEEKKKARYSATVLSFDNFRSNDKGGNKWYAIVGYLYPLEKMLEEYLAEYDVSVFLDGCMNFLNQIPKRKKFQKSKPRPKYGTISAATRHPYKVFKRDNISVLSGYFVVWERKNPNFWGEGLDYID